MKKIFYILLLFFSFSLKAQYIPLIDQKANLIFKIYNLLVWENDEEKNYFRFGVYKGSDELIQALNKRKPSSFRTGIEIDIEKVNNISDVLIYDILIVEKKYNSELPQILKQLEGSTTVLFSEEWDDKENIVFNLFTEKSGQKVNFEYNLENLAKYKVSILNLQAFYRLGGIDLGARKLLNKVKQELIETERLLKQKTKELEEQQQTINLQKKQIEEQKRLLAEKQRELQNKIAEINKQQAKLRMLQNQLANFNNKLKMQEELFKQKDLELKQKQREISQYEEKLKKMLEQYKAQEELLKKQMEDMKEIQKEVEEKKAELKRLNITIQTQRFALTIFVFLLIIIGILTFFIFRSYKIQKKQNILLEEQKNEITVQAKELEKINAELEKLSLVASETSNAVVILNKLWQIEWINKGFTKLYGYTLQLLEIDFGLNVKDIKIYENIADYLEKVSHTKQSVSYEHKVKTKFGNTIWIQTTITPIVTDQGKIRKIIIIDSDITKIKEAEEEIRKKNEKILEQARELELKNQELEKLSLVAERTDNGVAITNAVGQIEWVNPGFERLMKLSFEEFKAKYGDNIIFPFFDTEILNEIEKAIKNGTSATFTYAFEPQPFQKIWIQASLTPLFNSQGDITRLFAIYSDITKIKEAEEKIAKQNRSIRDSIKYASRIQRALLPADEFMSKLLDEYFVLYLPKDIVSGDFYWVRERNGKIFVTAADCTGHGVPGAFMSLLGITFLNEIITNIEEDKLFPNFILDELRNMVIESLQQKSIKEHMKDGMDMALIMIDKAKKEIHYAGANNQMILIRNKQLFEYQADDMPISFYKHLDPFKNNVIPYEDNDVIYLFSDGYIDQFGGPRGKKFMIKNFRKLLVEISDLPMEKQKQILHETHLNWRGKKKQIDDILVFGIRVK